MLPGITQCTKFPQKFHFLLICAPLRHVSAITSRGASRNDLTNSLMLRILYELRCTYATFVADGTHQTSTPIHHWRTNTCLTVAPSLLHAPACRLFASSVCCSHHLKQTVFGVSKFLCAFEL
jgi:hypothetical protein